MIGELELELLDARVEKCCTLMRPTVLLSR